MAPEHLRIETFHVIRSRLLSHKLSSETAKEAVRDLANLPLDVLPSAILLRRMWELRNDLSGYDAVYVAAAEHLGAPLVTFDKRLAGAPGLRCEVRIP
jgi:predicted nucleic acid-binding protein